MVGYIEVKGNATYPATGFEEASHRGAHAQTGLPWRRDNILSFIVVAKITLERCGSVQVAEQLGIKGAPGYHGHRHIQHIH